MFTLCQKEMPSIKFFGISKETMTDVRRNLQKQIADGKTIPGTRSSNHITPLSPSQIGHMLTSEDDSFVDTFDFNIPTTLEITDSRASNMCHMSVQFILVGRSGYRCWCQAR